jgi:hypothetical protein
MVVLMVRGAGAKPALVLKVDRGKISVREFERGK